MKKLLFLFTSLTLAGCSVLTPTTVEPELRTTPSSLTTLPGYDIYNLRADIVRQQTATMVNEVYMTEPMPYNKIGMRIGKELFFDMNNNLSIDLLRVLDVDETVDFTITKTYYRHNGELSGRQQVHKRQGGWYCVSNGASPSINPEKCIEIRLAEDSLLFTRKDRELYTITASIEQISLSKKGKTLERIRQEPGGQYASGVKRSGKLFLTDSSSVYLGNMYLVTTDKKVKEVKIYERRKTRNRLIKTVIESDNQLVVTSGRKNEMRIVRNGNRLTVFEGARKLHDLELAYGATRK